MKVMALDPGGDTGFAQYNTYTDHWLIGTLDEDNHHLSLWKLLNDTSPDVVICERFVYQRRDPTQGVSLELISRNYIGVIELWCQMRKVELVMQNVSDAKRMWTNANLKKLGLYTSITHQQDAVRHALLYITKKGDMSFIEKAKRPES